jgi:TolA-binding protein
MRTMRSFKLLRRVTLLAMVVWTASAVAQEAANRKQPSSPESLPQSSSPSSPRQSASPESVSDSVRELREQVSELQAAVAGMRSDWQRAREETAEMRRELAEIRAGEVPAGSGSPNAVLRNAVAKLESGTSESAGNLPSAMPNVAIQNQIQDQKEVQKGDQKKADHAASLEEEYDLLSGKVDDQYQTKVESASKYRVRLSGIVLMNLFSNNGVVDSIDLPTLSYPRPVGDSGGSFGATVRQSEIGFEAFGPNVAGAKTRADLQLDLAGGFPTAPNGVSSGYMRLRTATMRMDWANTSVVVGQDSIFFSPNSPTSFASLAIPALSYAGNLWNWVPQIRVEHRVSLGEDSSLLFQGGILDPLSGEAPGFAPGTDYYRQPGPGESSRQPAYGSRIAWTRNVFGQPLRVGVGAYYSRQDYGFGRNVDGWAGMTDIELPLNRQFSLSGKFYRGSALGGLYGGIGRSVLFSGDPTLATTEVKALNSVGGWAQLKYRPAKKWEFNAAFGMDNPFAFDLEYFTSSQAYGDPNLARNKGSFGNMIYRPRSDLLFSAEYRHLKTYTITNGASDAGQINLMMGVLF